MPATLAKYLVAAFTFFSFQAMAGLPFQSESSVPAEGLPFAVDVNKSFEKTIRVKVFPHDLKNDGVHGVADNPRAVALRGEGFSVNGLRADFVRIESLGKKLRARLDGGQVLTVKRLSVTSESPVTVFRERNPNKSHSYLGSLEVSASAGKIQIVNQIDIESYLKGVVPKESVSTWPIEALKAQAVAARTYAYYHLLTSNRSDYDVDDTARFQVYAGESASAEKTDEAIALTRGEVLTQDSKVVVAFFHAYSGGRTDSALNIFGNEAAHCQGSQEIFSREELRAELKPSSRWITEWTTDWMSKSSLMSKLKASPHSSATFKDYTSLKEYRVSELELNDKFDSVKTLRFSQNNRKASLNFINIRKVLGWSNFPAYHFRLLEDEDGRVAFKGHGWGHHVGMSQWGAFIMAKNYGSSYEEILHHYYTDVKLSLF